jgi:GH25 family lysozyme M1 (1,4-beta-N-acetylmuramidase)/acylphosphatase
MNKHLALGSLLLVPALATGCAAPESSNEDPASEAEGIKVCASGATVRGVDVSYYQGHIDWAKVKAHGVEFAIARVGDGPTYVDPQFAANWSGMKAAGVIRGTYQFFRAGSDPIKQADLLIKEIKDHGGLHAGDLPPMLDVEVQDGVSDATLRSHAMTWLKHVEAAFNRTPMIYTAPGFWNGLGADASFAKYTLVVANWQTNCPTMPNSWTHWKFWQDADNGSVPGISGHVDTDRFNGTLAQLKAFAGATVAPPPPPPTTSALASLGGKVAGEPAVGKNPDGRLEVFAVAPKGDITTAFQTSAGGAWSPWYSLGGDLAGRPVLANEKDGRLEIFARGSDNALWHAVQDAPNGKMGSWASLGGVISGNPTVVVNGDGRLEVFAVGTDGAVHHRLQSAVNGAGWAGWAKIGSAPGGGAIDPQALRGHDGNVRVFARGKDEATYVIDHDGTTWGAWKSLGGKATSAPSAVLNQDGRIEVFVRGTNGHLYHNWEKTPAGAWYGWFDGGGNVSEPVAANDADGRIEVLARGTDSHLYRTRQKAPNGSWEAWVKIGGNVDGGAVAARNKDGRLEAFFRATDDTVHHVAEKSPETW